jgi:hypothetical protein
MSQVRSIRNVRWWEVLSRLFLVLGFLLRLEQYLFNRSLWFDEAGLARNILARGPLALMRPLDYGQGAPILFLFLVKGTTSIFGSSEYALRLIPFIMGIIGLLLFYQTARLYLDRLYVPLAVFIFAFCYELVYYSAELKQYSTDVAVALLLYYLFLRLLSRSESQKMEPGLLGLAGCAALFLSHPAVFVLAGIACATLVLAARRQLRLSLRTLSFCLVSWLVCVAVNYVLFIKPLSASQDLHNYWEEGFLPVPSNLHSIAVWLHAALSYFRYLGFYSHWPYFIALLAAWAAVTELIKDKPVTLPLLLLLLFAVVASVLKLYPFSERLILFLAPAVILLAAKGVQIICRETNGAMFATLGIALIYPQLQSAYGLVLHPIVREEVRPILGYLDRNREPGDHVYVYFGASHAVQYYRRDTTRDAELFYYGQNSRTDRPHYMQDIAAMRQYPRVWFLFSHSYRDEEEFIISHITGQLLDKYHQPGASLYLYRFDRSSVVPAPVALAPKPSLQ